jgi:hypothetical protein
MMIHKLRFAFAIAGALVGLVLAPQAGAFDDNWQALQIDIIGSGTVTGSGGYYCEPDGNDYSYDCSKAYDYGALVNLTASAKPGWIFSGWGGCLQETGTICQVLLNKQEHRNTLVTATFTTFNPTPTQQVLTMGVDGPGRVTGSGIDCPGDCAQGYLTGSWVSFQAQPEPLATFTGWSGDCSGGPSAACVLKMDGARSVIAHFAADIPVGTPRSLTVDVTGSGAGSVGGVGIDCPGDCTQQFTVSADVTLTATAAAGSVFEGWGGACSGSAATCQVSMSTSRNLSASFATSPANPGQPGGANSGGGNTGDPGHPDNPGTSPSCTISGTPGNDVLVGTPRSDVICGLGGDDRLMGRGGNDILVGGAGADVLDGGRGHDYLFGGAGRDRLSGRAGRDRLDAGSGNDRLVGGMGVDRFLGGKGVDLLLARDLLQDRLDGGPGRDRARIDRKKDISKRVESLV